MKRAVVLIFSKLGNLMGSSHQTTHQWKTVIQNTWRMKYPCKTIFSSINGPHSSALMKIKLWSQWQNNAWSPKILIKCSMPQPFRMTTTWTWLTGLAKMTWWWDFSRVSIFGLHQVVKSPNYTISVKMILQRPLTGQELVNTLLSVQILVSCKCGMLPPRNLCEFTTVTRVVSAL